MKSSFFLSALFFCLLTLITNGQNLLPEQSIENFKKSKGLIINPDDEMSLHEKSMSRDLPWQVSAGQRQDPTINPRVNNRKKKDISKLNGSLYRPVTIVVENYDTLRYTYTHDNNGNCLTNLSEVWRNNDWGIRERNTYTYDNNGKMLTNLSEYWENNVWVIWGRYTYTYDNNGNCLTGLLELRTNNAWVNSWRYTSTYDNHGNILTVLIETWTNNAWVNSDRNTFTYDNNGNMLAELWDTWTNNAWVNNGGNTYTYDNNGNLLTQLSGNVRLIYTYDNNGNRLTGLEERWQAGMAGYEWVSYYKYTYTYNKNGNLLAYLRQEAHGDSILLERGTKTYDNNGNLLTELMEEHYTFDTMINSWKNIFTYDNNGNGIKGEHFQWMDNTWVPIRSEYQTHYNFFFYTPFLSYNSGADYIYFYDFITVSVTYKLITTDIKDNELKADTYNLQQNYPNPFNPTTVIQYALPYESNVSITVYNALGEVVKTFNEGTKQTGAYNVNFNGEGLSSGIYLYNINTVSIDGKQNFQATKKMILIK